MEDSELDFVDSSPSDNNHYNLYNNDTPGAFKPIDSSCYSCGYEVGIASGMGWSVAGMKQGQSPTWRVHCP